MSQENIPFPSKSFYNWIYDIFVEILRAPETGREAFLQNNDPENWIYLTKIQDKENLQIAYYRNENLVTYSNQSLRCHKNDALIKKTNARLKTRRVGIITDDGSPKENGTFRFLRFSMREYKAVVQKDNQPDETEVPRDNLVDLG